jgi:hypothetical protein
MDQRSAVRHRVLKAGKIVFDGSAITCMVRNMSDAGAMLDVATAAGIPEHFTLIMRADGRRLPCHVVWWKEKRVGVTFEYGCFSRPP